VDTPHPSPRTNWTRRVPPPVQASRPLEEELLGDFEPLDSSELDSSERPSRERSRRR
jgi:hypothetical protein